MFTQSISTTVTTEEQNTEITSIITNISTDDQSWRETHPTPDEEDDLKMAPLLLLHKYFTLYGTLGRVSRILPHFHFKMQ